MLKMFDFGLKKVFIFCVLMEISVNRNMEILIYLIIKKVLCLNKKRKILDYEYR